MVNVSTPEELNHLFSVSSEETKKAIDFFNQDYEVKVGSNTLLVKSEDCADDNFIFSRLEYGIDLAKPEIRKPMTEFEWCSRCERYLVDFFVVADSAIYTRSAYKNLFSQYPNDPEYAADLLMAAMYEAEDPYR